MDGFVDLDGDTPVARKRINNIAGFVKNLNSKFTLGGIHGGKSIAAERGKAGTALPMSAGCIFGSG